MEEGECTTCEGCSIAKCSEKVKPGCWEMSLHGFCSNPYKRLCLDQCSDSGNGER